MRISIQPTEPVTGDLDNNCCPIGVAVEHPRDDLTIWEVADLLRSALKGFGFHPDNIDEVIPDGKD